MIFKQKVVIQKSQEMFLLEMLPFKEIVKDATQQNIVRHMEHVHIKVQIAEVKKMDTEMKLLLPTKW